MASGGKWACGPSPAGEGSTKRDSLEGGPCGWTCVWLSVIPATASGRGRPQPQPLRERILPTAQPAHKTLLPGTSGSQPWADTSQWPCETRATPLHSDLQTPWPCPPHSDLQTPEVTDQLQRPLRTRPPPSSQPRMQPSAVPRGSSAPPLRKTAGGAPRGTSRTFGPALRGVLLQVGEDARLHQDDAVALVVVDDVVHQGDLGEVVMLI